MKLIQFDFTTEVIERFKDQSTIPVNFYNKNGQILINKKENASVHEINQLLKFQQIGIFYDQDDYKKLTGEEEETAPNFDLPTEKIIPHGLTDTKLLSREVADELTEFTTELFNKLKTETIGSVHARNANKKLTRIFDDFSAQPDAMVGLINILEIMSDRDCEFEVELAVKRTVIAMALKTRGMLAQTDEERDRMRKDIAVIMMATLLSDIAFLRMNLPNNRDLTNKEYLAMKQHPLISYLMIVSEPAIVHQIKSLVLFQHQRQKGKPNNYPSTAVIEKELVKRRTKYPDIPEQLKKLRSDNIYSHDANLLSIATRFSILTTPMTGRGAYKPVDAVRAIVNNASFSYTNHSIREFLDYSAISLCDNDEIIRTGDIIIVESSSYSSESSYEICMVMQSSRLQSRPMVKRFATIFPEIITHPKTQFGNFKLESIKPDKRHADIDLSRDNSRMIVFIVDPDYNPLLYSASMKVIEKA